LLNYFIMLKIDKDKCIGCGTCAALFPDFFRIGADGKAVVLKQPEKSREEEMAAVCPVEAIKVLEK